MDYVKADIPAAMHLRMAGFDVFAGYAEKRALRDFDKARAHHRVFRKPARITAAWTDDPSTLGFGFRSVQDYKFDPVDPYRRRRPTAHTPLPMQNPTDRLQGASFFFLSRTTALIDFNDEIGMQLDAFYAVVVEITLNLNGACQPPRCYSSSTSVSAHRARYSSCFGPPPPRDSLLFTNCTRMECILMGVLTYRLAINKALQHGRFRIIRRHTARASFQVLTLPSGSIYMLDDTSA